MWPGIIPRDSSPVRTNRVHLNGCSGRSCGQRTGVAVERAATDWARTARRWHGAGSANRTTGQRRSIDDTGSGHESGGRWTSRGRCKTKLRPVTAWHAVQDFSEVGGSLQYRLLDSSKQLIKGDTVSPRAIAIYYKVSWVTRRTHVGVRYISWIHGRLAP